MTEAGTLSSHLEREQRRVHFVPRRVKSDPRLEKAGGWSGEGKPKATITWSDLAASLFVSFL